MIDHLKTSKTVAIEALSTNINSQDLELIGLEPLKNVNSSLKYSIECGEINSSHYFKNVFGLDINFFYIIEEIYNGTVCGYERGIASIYSKNESIFLNRKLSLVVGKNSVDCYINKDNSPKIFKCCEPNHQVILSSTIPPTYLECLAQCHSVICSSESFLPQPVQIKKNSFLGRIDDNIENLCFDDERLIDKIANIIVKFSKQLKLKASKLSIKRIESEIIDMVPSSNIKAKRGSLYYDESDNKLKLYDGEQWRIISFTEE